MPSKISADSAKFLRYLKRGWPEEKARKKAGIHRSTAFRIRKKIEAGTIVL